MDNYNPNESNKKYIRVIFYDEEGKQIHKNRNDEYKSTVEDGYEDLLLREDGNKLNLYQTSKYMSFNDDSTYEIVKREFMPCVPVCLYLYLKEIK